METENLITNILENDYKVEKINENLSIIRGWFEGNFFKASIFKKNSQLNININGFSYYLDSKKNLNKNLNKKDSEINLTDIDKIFSPMTGTIKEVNIKNGNNVKKGDLLIKIEAMKLVLNINSTKDGIIKNFNLNEGEKISEGNLILEIE